MDWAIFLGSGLGVIAGALVQYLTQFLIDSRNRHRRKATIIKEIEYNKIVINQAISETRKMREAINTNNLESYICDFSSLNTALTSQLNTFVVDGSIFRYLDRNDMKLIFKYTDRINFNTNTYIINRIEAFKKILHNNDAQPTRVYQEATNFCRWLESVFDDASQAADALQDKLK